MCVSLVCLNHLTEIRWTKFYLISFKTCKMFDLV